MIRSIRHITVSTLTSPYGLAIVSYAFFLIAWVAPPALFMSYIGEPDILYLNLPVMFFYSGCVLCFMAGVRIFEFFRSSATIEAAILVSASPLRFLLVPLAFSTSLCVVSIAVLNGNVSNLGGLFVSQQGALIKLANASGQAEEGSWGYVLTFQTGMLWWAYSRSKQLITGDIARSVFRGGFSLALAVSIVTALIKVDRTNLIPIISGIFFIYIYARLVDRKATLKRLFLSSLGLGAVLLAFFFCVSYIRGASDAGVLIAGIFGYTATSYNRMAAEVAGLLHYSFGGRGIYLSTFLSFNNTINRIIPFNAWMGSPTERGVYYSEFSSVAAGGLNPGFNWSGAFGYIFADLGWWTPVYLLPVGIFNGYLWREFRRQNLVGIVLYPWAAFSILFWFGWNVLFDLRFALLAVVVVTMGVYETCFLGRRIATDLTEDGPILSPDTPPSDSPGSSPACA